jgi:hypothetical protein
MGYTLAILPELDDLTVGGLVAGCGIEVLKYLTLGTKISSLYLKLRSADVLAHRHGLF